MVLEKGGLESDVKLYAYSLLFCTNVLFTIKKLFAFRTEL